MQYKLSSITASNARGQLATFTSHRQALPSPTCPLGDRLKLFDATMTPSIRYAPGTWTVTEEVKEETPDSAMTDDEYDHRDKENRG